MGETLIQASLGSGRWDICGHFHLRDGGGIWSLKIESGSVFGAFILYFERPHSKPLTIVSTSVLTNSFSLEIWLHFLSDFGKKRFNVPVLSCHLLVSLLCLKNRS